MNLLLIIISFRCQENWYLHSLQTIFISCGGYHWPNKKQYKNLWLGFLTNKMSEVTQKNHVHKPKSAVFLLAVYGLFLFLSSDP